MTGHSDRLSDFESRRTVPGSDPGYYKGSDHTMTLGQLDPQTKPAWWVRETRVTIDRDGNIIYDPRLWWPMEVLKHVGRAFLRLRYSQTWLRGKYKKSEKGERVRTYRKNTNGYTRPTIRI